MKNLHKVSPLLGAIIAITGSAAVSAASYTVSLSGFAINQSTTIQNIPGVPTAPLPPNYQLPRLGAFGTGPGWNATLDMTLDAASGEVTDFLMTLREGGAIFGSGGPQWDIRADEREHFPSPAYGPAVCSVTNGGNDADGTLTYDCPPVTGSQNFAFVNHTGNLCATPNPSILAPGANGCGTPWGGFPAGFATPVVSTRAGQAVTLNQVIGGLTVALGGTNPPAYVSLDPAQNAAGIAVHEFQGQRAGGSFEILHTGTLAGGDFAVTGTNYVHNTDIAFVVATNPPGVLGAAQSFTSYDFSTVVSQDFELAAADAKNVPAMGAFGLAALFGGLVAVAARLRRRVS